MTICLNHEFINGTTISRKAEKMSKMMRGLGVLTSPSTMKREEVFKLDGLTLEKLLKN